MELLWFLRLAPLLTLMPCSSLSLSVRILNEEPVHVIPGSALLLRAHIQTSARDRLTVVTWERETETGPTPRRTVLATCPGTADGPCAGTKATVQANMEEQETTLQVSDYTPADGGDYIVTVTPQTGNTSSARCIVREYEAVHHVSVSINVSHSVLVCAEAWGTEPTFSWLYNRMALTRTVGQVSQDGTTLHVTQTPVCGTFTCRVSNKLGHATATYPTGSCEPPQDNTGTIAAVVCVLVLLVCGGLLALLVWWRHRRSLSSRERLHEHLDDS